MSDALVPSLPIFMVDDEGPMLFSYDSALRMGGFTNLVGCSDSREVMGRLAQHRAAVVLLDLMMPFVSGQDLLSEITQQFPGIPVVIITGNDTVETAVQCMKAGAFDFLVKPVERERLVTTVRQALSFNELTEENQALRQHLLSEELTHPEAFVGIVTNNRAMRTLFGYVEAIAKYGSTQERVHRHYGRVPRSSPSLSVLGEVDHVPSAERGLCGTNTLKSGFERGTQR